MPLYDMECEECGGRFEGVYNPDQYVDICSCGHIARRIYINIGVIKTSDDGGNHYKEILEVVDKEGGKHCQDFLRNPNRGTYEKWKAGAGVRHLERGEKIDSPAERRAKVKKELEPIRSKVLKKFKERQAIKVGG